VEKENIEPVAAVPLGYSVFSQHQPNSILALNLFEERIGETTMFVHLLALLRIM
jgi:hypothetical protein